MSTHANPYATFGQPVAAADADVRATFIKRTYLHLAGAVFAFLALSVGLQQIPGIEKMVATMMGGKWNWLIVVLAFMGTTHLFDRMAQTATSQGMQYLALGGTVTAWSILFVPVLWIASNAPGLSRIIPQAGVITLFLFAGLTLIAFTTRADFSFLGGFLKIGSLVGIGLIAANMFFVASSALSLVIIGGFILIASCSILYQTSAILRTYPADRYVGAAVGLFGSVALLFWYVLQLLMSLSSD